MTCLFWFESVETLRIAERELGNSIPQKRLAPEATASTGFRKWVVTILQTTQVSQNVILLALLFIYRLKTANPTVRGNLGSEYRLLTVALMLGNKFLDDNTYTNKTWAEVSGITVNEIHTMEVEFLGNMRYSLMASKEEWEEWRAKLARFWDYTTTAAALAPCDCPYDPPSAWDGFREGPSKASPAHVPRPSIYSSSTSTQPTLPSPPSLQTSPPSSSNYSAPPITAWPQPTILPPPVQEPPLPNYPRKRSCDETYEAPVPKRVASGLPASFTQNLSPPRAPMDNSFQNQALVRPTIDLPNPASRSSQRYTNGLSNPYLGQSNSTNVASHSSNPTTLQPQTQFSTGFESAAPRHLTPLNASTGSNLTPRGNAPRLPVPQLTVSTSQALPAPAHHAPVLPPPTTRAMSTVYPTPQPSTPTWTLTPTSNRPSLPNPLFTGHSHTRSPGYGAASSPLSATFAGSPSAYLMQRNSPYGPVRHFDTLLYPPPDRRNHRVPEPEDLHFQPLGRSNGEYCTGVVPDYLRDNQPSCPAIDPRSVRLTDMERRGLNPGLHEWQNPPQLGGAGHFAYSMDRITDNRRPMA